MQFNFTILNKLQENTHQEKKKKMMILSPNTPLLLLASSIFLLLFINPSTAHDLKLKQRNLLSIKETPSGGNLTYDCSPSGPCIPCTRSEKGNEKYRCAETGYRIRLKCVPSGSGSEDAKNVKEQKTRSTLESKDFGVQPSSTKQRRILDESSKSTRSYVTYRSCIPAVSEEKLSVLGFEALILSLLVSSGLFMYLMRKRSIVVAGGVPVRLPTNSRF